MCTYGKCECNAACLWEKLQQRSRVTKFLMGLNDSYEATRTHILMLKPIPSIEDTFNMVTQDERQKSIKQLSKSDNVVFQASDNQNQTIKSIRIWCYICLIEIFFTITKPRIKLHKRNEIIIKHF